MRNLVPHELSCVFIRVRSGSGLGWGQDFDLHDYVTEKVGLSLHIH